MSLRDAWRLAILLMESYLKSGAVNRFHYALAHKVENATSIQEADEAVWLEVQRVRVQVAQGLASAREELVILMYCYNAATAHTVSAADLEFALPPAVNLAATGRAVKDRRIGLTFCAMFMSVEHPLQLMLVNTLRKEIESEEPARIALAIDFIVSCPSQFLAPAVAPRLEVLLSHKSQNLRRRAILALRALDSIPSAHSPSDSPRPSDSHLSHHKSTIMRRLTRAAREDHVRADEVGAVGALLAAVRELLQSRNLTPSDIIPPVAALLEKIILSSSKAKRKSQQPPRKPHTRLVTPLIATLQSAVTTRSGDAVKDSVLADIAKLAIRVTHSFAERPVSPPILQAFRLLGAIPTPLVHALLQTTLSSTTPSTSPTSTGQSTPKATTRHPVPILHPLLLSRDPTERWAGLACLQALDASLWAGVPLNRGDETESGEGDENGTIPAVLDEWEVGAIMRGLGDPDKTLRQLTMRVLHGVDPQLLHAFLEQLIVPPSSTKQRPGEALEVLYFLCATDGAGFARGVGRILAREGGKRGVDDKLVEGVVVVLFESDQLFRSAFADTMLGQLEASGNGSLISPITGGASTLSSSTSAPADPTAALLFATSASDVTVNVQRAVDVLLGLLPGRGAGIQEVLLLAALRLVPRLQHDTDVNAAWTRVEVFGQSAGLGRHIRRRCEIFIRFSKDLNTLRGIVEETKTNPLPKFFQTLLSRNPPPPAQPAPSNQIISPPQSPRRPAISTSPAFSTVSLSNSPALRYDAYAPPQPAPRRARPALQSPFQRGSGESSTSGDSPFVRKDEDLAGEMVLQAADQRKAKGKGKADGLQINMHGSPKAALSPNPNADLITLSAVESPFREETDFSSLTLSDSQIALYNPDPATVPPALNTSGSTMGSSPRFHTATMTSPRIPETDLALAPIDADAIWSSFDAVEGDTVLGKQTLRGWCERAPDVVGVMLRGMGVGFVTQKVAAEEGAKSDGRENEVFAFIPSPSESPDSEVAKAVVRLRPAEDGSCLWMLRCSEWELRVKIRKLLDGESN